MSLLAEYIEKKLTAADLEKELLKLIARYNEIRQTYLLVYASATEKPIPLVSLMQADFYTIRDLLSGHKHHPKVDLYLETRGGSGETAEEIVRFLHDNFETVSFVISGEAKSAGTIIALSGDEILMTETGSLGPIDAQMRIGRSVVSAYDYLDWINEKRKSAEKEGVLNPFDATMVAQINPGELGGALHAQKFAEDLVVEWLTNYKFRNWKVTETKKKPVTMRMKKQRARAIARALTKRSKWRSHGKSIKIKDLESEDIRLKITAIDEMPELAEIVYRIQTVCRFLFDNTNSFKIFATAKHKIFRQAVQIDKPIKFPKQRQPDVVNIEQRCPKCGIVHRIYGKFVEDPRIDLNLQKKGLIPFPKDGNIKCQCGFEIDLIGIRNQIEMETGRKVITSTKEGNHEGKKKAT